MWRPKDDDPSDDSFHPAFPVLAIMIGALGALDLLVWLLRNNVVRAYRRWLAGEIPEPVERMPVNRPLRAEVLHFTTRGIALCSLRPLDAKSLPAAGQPLSHALFPTSLTDSDSRGLRSWTTTVEKDGSLLDALAASPLPRSGSSVRDARFSRVARAGRAASTAMSSMRTVFRRTGSRNLGLVPFHDYAPVVFRHLRGVYRIDESQYQEIFSSHSGGAISEKFSEGRSGAFFYFTSDRRYIVKTLEAGEADALLRLLPSYAQHMTENPNTLMNKFCGFHSIRMYHQTVYFVVMESVFLTTKKIHERYDLKGSWVDRNTGIRPEDNPDGKIMKDNDLHQKLQLADTTRTLLLLQLERDTLFLAAQRIMDYSLLLGIHRTRRDLYVRAPVVSSDQQARLARYKQQRYTMFAENPAAAAAAAAAVTPGAPLSDAVRIHVHGSGSGGGGAADGVGAPSPVASLGSQAGAWAHTVPEEPMDAQSHVQDGGLGRVQDSFVGSLSRPSTEHDLRSLAAKAAAGGTGAPARGRTATGSGESASSSLGADTDDVKLKPVAQGSTARSEAAAPASLIPQGHSLDRIHGVGRTGSESSVGTAIRQDWSENELAFVAHHGGIGARVLEGPGIYFVGLIDILQRWTWKKRAERFLKTTFLRKDPRGLSAIEPVQFQERFMKRAREITRPIADDELQHDQDA